MFILNQIIEFLDKYASLLLVIITAVYAFLTYRIASIMRRQIIANIKIAKISLRSHFSMGKEDFSNAYLRDLVKKFSARAKDAVLFFHVSADFLNLSSGSGTIDQPKLILKFKGSKFSHKVRPTKERIGGERKTICLPGGGFEKIDLEYFCSYNNKSNKELFDRLKRYPDDLEYYISYNDNSGRKYLVKIDEISGLK